MELADKLKILADSAKYDVSCVSSGSSRKNTPGGIGSAAPAGICHSFASDGRCISLLKILMSNCCIYDCVYCVNRVSNDVPRTTFTPEELVDLTINFYRRNYIEGLFLSSAVVKNPDHTMEQILKIVKTLRIEYKFNGYIHVKAIPGADSRLIDETGSHVDRMSINIELPTSGGLKLLAPQKDKHSILGPMQHISDKIAESSSDYRSSKKAQPFVPAGQSTQLIVGATPDRDLGILRLSESLYKRFSMRRVFYSAYVPVSRHPALPSLARPPLLREHRLYQADWLLRFYHFNASELLDENHQDFDTRLDPKCDWALRNMAHFPVEVNKAEYTLLLRVPGIGVRSAQRIVSARRMASLGFEELKKLGVVLKRARYFITCKGKYYDKLELNDSFIRQNLLADKTQRVALETGYTQVSMFMPGVLNLAAMAAAAEKPEIAERLQLPSHEDVFASTTGEL